MRIKNIFSLGLKASTFFFIAGTIISMLVTSVGISSTIASQQLINTKYELETGEQYQLVIQPNNKLNDNFYSELHKILPQGGGLFVDNINLPASFTNQFMPRIYPEIFKGDTGIFPLLKGKYFNYENIKNKDRVALVGKETELQLTEKNGEKFVTLSGTSYKVIGIVGYKNKKSIWDLAIFIPINSFPDKYNNTDEQLQFTVYNKQGNIEAQLPKLRTLISDTGIGLMQSRKVIPKKMSFWQSISPSNNENFVIYIFFIVSLINSLNIALSWITKRRYEIGIRKAFGYTNLAILNMIFKEMLLLFSIGAAIAIFIHLLIIKTIGTIIDLPHLFPIEAVTVSLVLVFISTLLTTVYISSKTLAVQPIEVLKL